MTAQNPDEMRALAVTLDRAADSDRNALRRPLLREAAGALHATAKRLEVAQRLANIYDSPSWRSLRAVLRETKGERRG